MTREDNLRILIEALSVEIELTTPLGPGPVKVADDGGAYNRMLEVRSFARRKLKALLESAHTKQESKPEPPPVDRSARVLVSGESEAERPDYREIKENGQQQDYVVLTQEERSKGFVRPVRRSYIHQTCGASTRISDAIAETYARDPGFYSGTFCCVCRAHFPIGAEGEFVWEDGTKVGTYR